MSGQHAAVRKRALALRAENVATPGERASRAGQRPGGRPTARRPFPADRAALGPSGGRAARRRVHRSSARGGAQRPPPPNSRAQALARARAWALASAQAQHPAAARGHKKSTRPLDERNRRTTRRPRRPQDAARGEATRPRPRTRRRTPPAKRPCAASAAPVSS
ncbi:unnamed protein product, partial [Prorocentrum cordatum]